MIKKTKTLILVLSLACCLLLNAQANLEYLDYTHEKSASLSSRIVEIFLKTTINKKKEFKRLTVLKDELQAEKIPNKILKNYIVDTVIIQNRNVFSIIPKSGKSGKYIIYLHGGGYVKNISKAHWWLIEKLAEKTNATIVVPDYPLAPVYNAKESIDFLHLVYKEAQSKSENIIIMGDSAGGGLSLVFAQDLKTKKLKQPSQIILLTPWLDVSSNNPEMNLLEKKDPILYIKTLQLAGEYWADDLNTKHPLVSPIYGELEGLASMSIFVGGKDILYPQAKALKRKLEILKANHNYFYYPKMFHVWMGATFTKEAKLALNQIAELIN